MEIRLAHCCSSVVEQEIKIVFLRLLNLTFCRQQAEHTADGVVIPPLPKSQVFAFDAQGLRCILPFHVEEGSAKFACFSAFQRRLGWEETFAFVWCQLSSGNWQSGRIGLNQRSSRRLLRLHSLSSNVPKKVSFYSARCYIRVNISGCQPLC